MESKTVTSRAASQAKLSHGIVLRVFFSASSVPTSAEVERSTRCFDPRATKNPGGRSGTKAGPCYGIQLYTFPLSKKYAKKSKITLHAAAVYGEGINAQVKSAIVGEKGVAARFHSAAVLALRSPGASNWALAVEPPNLGPATADPHPLRVAP
jgi:hypothetical protein